MNFKLSNYMVFKQAREVSWTSPPISGAYQKWQFMMRKVFKFTHHLLWSNIGAVQPI